MSKTFEYNAPQFVDFNDGQDDTDVDTFFDTNESPPEEDKENKLIKIEKTTPIKHEVSSSVVSSSTHGVGYLKEETIKIQTQVKREVGDSSQMRGPLKKAVRRLSEPKKGQSVISDAEVLSENLNKLSVKAKKRTHFEGIPIIIKEEKNHHMTTRNDEAVKTPRLELRTRVVSKDLVVENRKRKNVIEVSAEVPMKYRAMAEQILLFQRATPPRFHTSKRRSSGNLSRKLKARQSFNPRRTIALTPKLMTAFRSRPVEAPSQQEKEEMELEDIKSHQIKALPLNEKVLQPPKPPRKSEKPHTVPEPFHLTQVFKKPAPKANDEPYKFTARPVPKTILEKPVGVGARPELPVTVPQSPAIRKPARYQQPIREAAVTNDNKEEGVSSSVPKKTQIKPFSFETRTKEMFEKKKKKIQQVLEAEKKAREFKATPVPAFVTSKESSRFSQLDCSKMSTNNKVEESHHPFKAKSPRVLRKLPFQPIKPHTHTQPLNVQLHTELRVVERRPHELRQLEKEEKLACYREQLEMERKQREAEEIARLRQETVHKAQPMPKFKPLPVRTLTPIPLTEPKSPRFSKRSRTNFTDQ